MNFPATKNEAAADAPLQWLEQHGDMLYAYALARVRSKDAAEDLVQETLLAGIRGLAKFDGRSSVQTWLTGILKHKILDYVAARIKQPEQMQVGSEDDFFTARGKWKNAPTSWEIDPASRLEQTEFRTILDQCLDKLPRRTAELFILFQSDETTTEQICKETGLTSTNIWSILYRARLRLRECLSINWFDGEEKRTTDKKK